MLEQRPLLLAVMPPTTSQTRAAATVAALVLSLFLVALPFPKVQLAPGGPFVAVVDTILFLSDVITACLLFAQYSVMRSRGLLVLATGYLFTGLIIVPHGLTFPGVFSRTGLLGADFQTAVWLYAFWHAGLPIAVIGYALSPQSRRPGWLQESPAGPTIVASCAGTLALALGLTVVALRGQSILPSVMVDGTHWSQQRMVLYQSTFVLPLLGTAIVMMWRRRRRSVLDLWLFVALWAWLLEYVLIALTSTRYGLFWYTGRLFGLLSGTLVLLVLLSETTKIYARLALSVLAEHREREGRLMSMEAMSAAIEHEIRQPLGAILANTNAGQRWLARSPPEIGEVSEALNCIAADAHRSSEVIRSFRAMFGKRSPPETPLDANDLVRETVALLRRELDAARITLALDLAEDLPRVPAHRAQLQQVLLNLANNAIDAMRELADREAVLRITSRSSPSDGVELIVSDTGIGIDARAVNRVFDPFYTTKPNGMGMGLAICRSIVEAHGGTLSMSPGSPCGSAFRFSLPAAGANGASPRSSG